jgi:hypothetical protein
MSLHPEAMDASAAPVPPISPAMAAETEQLQRRDSGGSTGAPKEEEPEDMADQVASGIGRLMLDPGGTART